MHIRPFKGIRYSDRRGRPGELAAPPYDQINDARRDAMHQTPFQFAHLSRPVPGEAGTAHEHAASLHEQWLDEGVLVQDDTPSLYGYAIDLPTGGTRLGLSALIGIEPEDSRVIQPHEETVEKTVEERLNLLRTMQVDLEPILLLSDDGGALDALLSEDCSQLTAAAEHTDEFGNVHRLVRISDPARVQQYVDTLAPCRGPIADGHHRYKTSRLYGREIGASHASNAGCKLGVITSLASQSLTIEPIHRALSDSVDDEALAGGVIERRTVEPTSGAAYAAAISSSRQPAIGVWCRDQAPEIWQLDPSQGPATLPKAASELSVVLLHRHHLPAVDLGGSAATDGTILYRSNPEELFASQSEGEFAVSLWLPSMEPELFAGAIADGDLLPPKSTRFMPKVVSGLVWATHLDDS